MKYLERMARRAGGRPYHSVFSTTFAIEFAAFEELMLPQLMASGATNLVVVADERMASMVLSDGSRLPEQLGRDYILVSPPISDGLFHPKIVLQIGRKGGRLFVGSANITAAGLAGNAETVIEVQCSDEPSPEREILRAVWRYVEGLARSNSHSSTDAVNWALDRAAWLRGGDEALTVTLDDGTLMAFLTRSDSVGIGQRFLALVDESAVERLVVASPYWDADLSALAFFEHHLEPIEISILLDTQNHQFPLEATLPPRTTLRHLPRAFDGRFAHAKIFIATTEDYDHVLIGSANCTTPALGAEGYGGSNAEACIYRRFPAGRAVEVLGLVSSLEQDPLDPASMEPWEPPPPIPLEELALRRAGVFELEGDVLTWTAPRRMPRTGSIHLLDGSENVIDTAEFDLDPDVKTMSFRISVDRRDTIRFAIVDAGEFVSNKTFVTQRSVLRTKRREIATGAVARAIEVFDVNLDFEVWMHQAADELARADLSEHLNSSPPTPRAHHGHRVEVGEPTTRFLSYEEFMETRKPDARSEDRQNSLSGTHSDRIRQFMNDLVGQARVAVADAEPEDDQDWLDLGDENEDAQVEADTKHAETSVSEDQDHASAEVWIDAGQFEKMVDKYVERLMSSEDFLGASDVLRVRFWLMMLLHKARTVRLPNGLEASTDDRGWPRMAFRIISSFFCGRRPPVTRLMVSREYTEMPTDFLECWTTVLWTLNAIEGVLPPSPRNDKFLHFVRRVRPEVVKVLGLTPLELESDTVLNLRQAMDRTVGVRLMER